MTVKNTKSKLTGHALIWAAMMIAISLILQNSEKSFHVFLIMIAGWYATQTMIMSSKAIWRAECDAYREMMGASKPKE